MADTEVPTGEDRRSRPSGARDGAFRHRFVHEVFEERAAAAPGTIALDGPREALTYGELNERATALAGLLQRHGAGPEVVVGLYLPRGEDFVVAQLATLKAGAAYLPLDVGDPPSRTAEMLGIAGAALVLTCSGHAGRIGEGAPETLVVDQLDPTEQPDEPRRGLVGPANLAYVVFTSGSTGSPKPVAVTHGALANHLSAIRDRYGLTTVDRVLQFANPAFDVVAEEVFPTLGAGGCVVIASRPAMAPAELQRFLETEGVTVANLPTSYWTEWTLELEALDEPPPASLRLLVVGTEKAPTPTLVRWWQRSDVPVVNAYGLSETTITVATKTFLPGEVPQGDSLPVGTPIAQCEAFVYDAQMDPTPAGETGELWIAGQALARGYPGLADLTAERFLPHPGRHGARLFRTGDLARVLPGGDVEILGRVDRQLKIRGHRVEPSEIEIALASHPDVGHAFVRPEGDPALGATRLVAYVAPADVKRIPAARSLGEHLRGKVPGYMLPAGYVVLPEMPRKPNGKIDADALPDTDPLRGHASTPYAPPRTETERWLVDLWQDVLFVDRVGIDDDFFELGGHSLSAMQVGARIRSATGAELSIAQVIATTPRVLAAEIDALRASPKRPEPAAVEREERATTAPLSFQQEQVWFHTKLAPESIAYQTQTTIRVVGPFDPEVFERAVTEIVRRHEIFRTVYREVDGRPEQVVLPPSEAGVRHVTHVDLSTLPQDRIPAELDAVTREELGRPFDLSRLPLKRWTVVRLGPEEHELILVEHHMVHDGWSFTLLMADLTKVYGALVRGEEPAPEDLPIRYRDYARSQREAFDSGAMLARRDAWWEELEGISRSPELPSDRKRREYQRFVGRAIRTDLPPGLPALLRDYCRAERITAFAAMFAAFALLVSRYTEEDYVAISSAFANRNASDTERVIGMFVNPVLLRCNLAGVSTFRELTSQVYDTVLRAMQNQEFPFAEVVKMLNPVRDATRNPLVGLMFSFNDAPMPRIDFGDASGTVFESTNDSAKTDLNVVVMPRATRRSGEADQIDDRVTLLWEYNSDLFDAATIKRLTRHYEHVLEALTADPDRPLSEFAVTDPAEHDHVVSVLNDTAAGYQVDRCIHELFESQALQTPDAIALVAEDQELTYRELDERANRLAHYLAGKGVGPEVVTGICLERGVDLVVALLAIWKARGAYVPLDPEYPRDRLAFMLDDTAAPVVVTTSELADRVDVDGVELALLDVERDVISAQPDTRPAGDPSPDDLAYVIYTSGSTGVPKGVAVAHRGVCNRLLWMKDLYAVGPGDAVLQKTPFTFDVSVWELFAPLVSGARLVMARPGGHKDPRYLADAIDRHDITIVQFVPSMLTAYLAEAPPHHRPRLTICSGEALPPQTVAEFKARYDGELHNLYGPTEGSIEVTYYPCDDGDRETVPIGRPIANIAVYVLDPHGNPVPVGVPGELYIGGVGVVRGYLNRPALTAERFVPDPFSSVPGARLYRTGDRARWLRDGNVEFLGRADHQVKIRGFRIEPGEIEAALTSHEAVRDAAVVPASRDHGPDTRLVAYVVGNGSVPAASDLRAHLSQSLPDYMIPAYFVVLDELPSTSSGKLDRAALPAPEGRPDVEAVYVAPRTPAEEALARIWCDVLGVDRVGIHDNFYELGGDSILSLQIVARANATGLGLTPRLLFQQQTVAGLAAAVRTRPDMAPDQGPVTGEVPLTPIQRWFFERDLTERHHFNQSRLLNADGADPGLIAKALAALVEHHDALRLRFTSTEDGWVQRHAAQEDAGFFTVEDGDIAEVAARLQASLDLERGPLLRAAYFDLGNGRTRLFVCIHHLAVDGVSWRILLDDLRAAYDQLRRGEPIRLAPKTTSFQQWAERLAGFASSEDVLSELDYWSETGAASFELPLDHELGPNDEGSTEQVTVALTAAETEALLQDVPAAYRTHVNDVMVAALVRAVAGWTGEDRVLIDLEGHGREDVFDDVDLTRTVGWFTSLFPVALEVPSPRPSRLLKSVKEQLRAVPRRGLGYGVLRYLAAADVRERVVSRAPLSFNYLGRFGGDATPELFSEVPGPTGPGRAGGGTRSHVVEVDGRVAEGCLHMRWTYSRNLHRRDTIERVAAGFVAALRELVAHCSYDGAGGVTPSDFPLADLDQAALDALWSKGLIDRSTQDVYPLTPLQQGTMFHTLYEPGSTVYFQQLGLALTGRLDTRAFERAWRETFADHDALRSAVLWEGLQHPVQVVTRDVALPLEKLDWRHLDAEARAELLDAHLAADRARGFDLQAAPLVRMALIRMDAESWAFVWSFHHVLLDGWSVALVLAELWARYGALVRGEAVEVSAAPPYREYVAWLKSRDAAGDERYWRDRLAGFAVPTPLPDDGPSGPDEVGRHAVELDAATTAALDRLARRERVTLSTIVQGAWALLLSRYSGEDDVVFGATVSGRPADLPGVQKMVGLFINTIPVRVEVGGATPVSEWLRWVHADGVERSAFEYAALTDIHAWSDVPAGVPLFDAIVVFENYPGRGTDASGADLSVSDLGGFERTNYALTLIARPGGDVPLEIAYDRSRFRPSTVERMGSHIQNLLVGMTQDPARPLSELDIMSAPERHHMVVELNEVAPERRVDDCIHELFEARVRKTPDATALASGDLAISYSELNRRANRLAHHLRSLGVGPEVPVGISLERGVDLVVALLAVFKAGGAYVPLDPGYPAERRAFMVEDTGAAVVVTAASLDADRDAIAARPDTDLGRVAVPDDLAYVIYTSGSTGTPKGVAVTHGSLARHCVAMADHYSLGEADRVLAFGSFNFDVSLEQTLTPLIAGASVFLRDAERWDPRALVDDVHSRGLTVLNPPTAYWHQLADDAGVVERLCAAPSLRLVAAGGEAMSPERVRQWMDASRGRVALLNNYGPTEATITATSHPVAETVRDTVPIGRPVAGTSVYVLDVYGNPVPIGCPGELYLGGPGVARGYVNRPGLTAERFVPDPFCGAPGARLYRTGDRGRYLEGGELEFLGRFDDQVKVRGFRIEPGEIEACLVRHDAVREAVVVARQETLVAYLVAGSVTTGELRAHVAESLPGYMVPGSFVMLDELPLTPNGKVDRAALPAPGGRGDLGTAHVAPRTPAEEVLAEIWCDVLGLERVGVHDDFFELGGHSLVATRVVSRARAAFSVELPIRALFDSPTVAELATVVGGSPRRELPAIEPVARDSELPLSFAQQRLWFLDRLEPGSAEYNIPHALRIRGTLDAAALERALSGVVARHETLRTTFATVDGEPRQVVHAAADVALEVTDLTHLDNGKGELEARQIAAAEAVRPFDLERGPLLRARLLRLDQDDHVLLLTMHHVVSDGWSRSVLVRELSALYEGDSLPELPVQYADFAAWQREWLSGEVLERQLDYWRERLSGLAPVLELPADRARPAVRSGRGGTVALELDAATMSSLKALSRAHNATLFMTLTAAFQALLSRYSGSDDVAIGTPVAGRSHPDAEGLIGFFVNTLVLRCDLSGDPTFSELVGRVRDVALDAYAHQDVPFEKLVQELRPQRSTSHTPLFQVMVALDNTAAGELRLGDASVASMPVDYDTSKFDLTLSFADDGSAVLAYNADLFEAATVERMAGHLGNLLDAVASDPAQRLSELEVMSPSERDYVVAGLNDTGSELPDRCVHELFQEQVKKAPDAVALVSGDAEIAYAELNRRANRLAHHLLGLGVGPEVPVGISLERGVDLIVGLLAILKAGGAYVPLDPGYPAERLDFMLEDTGASVVVTAAAFDAAAGCPETDPITGASPDDLAYVIYTSGSTGRPKGVAVTHSNVVRLVSAGYVDVGPDDVFLQFAPVSFDASTFEVWVPLLHGARIAIADPDVASPEELTQTIERHGVTVAWLTASLFNLVVDTMPEGLEPVRRLLTGGDALSPRHVATALRHLPRTRLVNGYGPTESTTFACCYDIFEVPDAATSIPIGRPISSTTVYILDAYGNPAPIGVPGELFVGGAGVARGYVERPALTAERFVPDPFSPVPGARLYRTGDRARYLPDGNIEFLGRADHQVKIRGFRIEPGEVEAALLTHDAVDDAVVVARDERLVGYLVAESAPATAELRAHLGRTLPDYMVPGAFVVLDELPLTPNGKVDRAALPAPDLGTAHVGPRTPEEEMLAEIWCEVLRLDRIGVHDDFFELGGHSLVATQVVSRAGAAFSVDVPLRALFESPTVAGLAAAIASSERGDFPPIEPVGRDSSLPLSFGQQRLWFLDQLEPGSSEYNIPHALRVRGNLDVAALERALSEVVARHEALRTTFGTVDGEPVQVVHPPAPVHVDVVDAGEREAREIAMDEATRPFDLERGPLLRVRALRLAPDDHVLLVTMHHIVSDGWSGGVFTRELSALYEGERLAALPVQYADFAAWQRRWLADDVLERQLGYWRERLAGLAPVLDLPLDHPRPAVRSSRAGVHSFALGADTVAALHQVGRAHNATLFMTLTAAFQALLSRYSGSDDVAIGTPIAGRTRPEVEDLIGFFVNTLVLRTDLSGDPSFGEVVDRVREVALGAYAHQDVPFEKLVEELHPQRSLSHTPLFQVTLSLDHGADARLALGDARVDRFPTEYTASKFDLQLALHETGGGLAGDLLYNADLFEPGTIDRLARHLTNLVKAIAADPGRRLSELDLMDVAERRHVVVELNEAAAERRVDDCIHELFEAQVRETPDAVAVASGSGELTYAEVNRRANRLAHHLAGLGVGPEVPVGMRLERGPDLVVGLLAILKAGGAYVPLDPHYPVERLEFMLEDTGASVVVTSETFHAAAACPETDPARVASPDHLAYVIYTSGSTGTPKGVAVEHRSLAEHCVAMAEHYSLSPADRVLVFASFNFDVSLEQTLAPLISGAGVVMGDAERWDPAALVDEVTKSGLTFLNPPTAYWHQLAGDRDVVERLCAAPSLRLVAVGGEAMAPARLREWNDAVGGRVPLLNNYGPTETTITATSYAVTGSEAESVPIGRPVANTAVYILDAYGNPVPIGVPGELYVGGSRVARGYLNRPGLTAERFVPDPFSPEPGARLYRTGDRVRYLESGDIEFLGRIDDQVKVRGFRIEPGEIEAGLLTHEGVRDAVVVARNERLVAYVVGEATGTELSAHLGGSLPGYMIPTAFVALDELPLTPNGKVDRAALPAPEAGTGYIAPRTRVEEIVAEIWRDVLGLERLGVHDDFFELGGHSLVATRVVSHIRAVLGIDVGVRRLFESPTVEELAREVERIMLAEVEGLSDAEVTRELGET